MWNTPRHAQVALAALLWLAVAVMALTALFPGGEPLGPSQLPARPAAQHGEHDHEGHEGREGHGEPLVH